MVGLSSGTHSKAAVLGGILTIAVADSLSDALGIHLSEESKKVDTAKHIWEATLMTFAVKFVVTGSFVPQVLIFPLDTAVRISVGWGLALLTVLSFILARSQRVAPWKVIAEHLFIAGCVLAATDSLGKWVQSRFNESG
jgi:VIT1/CCC1 family predicted Fe2+/Mn2+ transporter